jgi:hypothetical protein
MGRRMTVTETDVGPSWKHRRRLIYASYVLATLMVVSGGLMFMVDQFGNGVALITGGVSLISIVLTAYTGFAAYEDVKLWSHKDGIIDGEILDS